MYSRHWKSTFFSMQKIDLIEFLVGILHQYNLDSHFDVTSQKFAYREYFLCQVRVGLDNQQIEYDQFDANFLANQSKHLNRSWPYGISHIAFSVRDG